MIEDTEETVHTYLRIIVVIFQCGKSALVYRYGCPKCLSTNKSYKPCSVCNNVSHLPSECPETWRRYHATV